ncbi:hypothetical protein WM24_29440 [Burkholderia ubonensis]|nr:hypothetical protein WM24_29440 [Burkholderia ubonensis]
MIDDMGRKRQERRFALQSTGNLKEAIEHVYGVSVAELKVIFGSADIDSMPEDLPACVEVRNLDKIGVNAFLVRQIIEVAQVPPYIKMIREGREETSWQRYDKGGLHTLVKHDQELSGVNMRLLTNDVELVRQLAEADFNPPCPWIAFYELGPFVGSMQGNAEYWYHHIWDKYWESLSIEDQDAFLEKKRRETVAYMSDQEWGDWVSELRFRDPRTRDLI